MRISRVAIILGAALAVAGCSSKGLRDLRTNSEGPDEFLILPSKPLSAPESYAALPTPTPGGANLVDQNPKADAVVALGGRAETLNPQGVPSTDGALVAQASRHGVSPQIRETLAEADAKFRKRQSRGTRIRLFPVDRYVQAYRRNALDPFDETERFRRSGFATPSSPPEKP
ncbi:DUF3035 domain-containing protein [Arenibacterium sp. CAU 1754]